MDDFVDRFLKTIALICAGFVLLYVLIATSSERPTGVSLIIFNGMNWLFYWLIRLIAMGLIVSALVFARYRYVEAQTEKEQLAQEEIKNRESELREEERKKEEEKQKKLRAEEETRKKQEREIENMRLQKVREEYLKNRSADQANKDALKNFL